MNPRTRYFTSSLAVAATGVCTNTSRGSVVITPQNTSFTHAGGGQLSFDITGDADPDYSFVYANNNNTKPQLTSEPFPGGGAYAPEHIMMPNITSKAVPADLAVGSVIDGSLYGGMSFWEGFLFRNFDNNAFGEWGGPDTDNPTGPVEGYIALRIETGGQGSGTWNYGYAHVRVDVPGGTIKVFETGYETDPNTAITIPPHDPALVVPDAFTGQSDTTGVTLEISVSNGGATNPLTITSAVFTGIDADYFTINETYPLVIGPGGSIDFSVDFDPEGLVSTFSATLELTSDDPFAPVISLPVTVEVGQPNIQLPASLELGPFASGDGAQALNVEIQNSGYADLEIYDAYFAAGPYSTRFAVTHDFIGSGLTAAGQGSVNLPFSFDPTGLAAGVKSAVITLSTNDPDNPTPTLLVNVEVSAPPQETTVSLAHRWSFDDLSDSAGSADATLVGAASVSGGSLVLPGGGVRQDYASVPVSATIAAASSLSFEGWFTPVVPDPLNPIPQDWTKVWMFGIPGTTAETVTYLDFTWDSLLDFPSANFRNGTNEVHTRDGDNPPGIPAGSEAHVVVVYDAVGHLISIYVNGTLADSVAWTGEIHDLGITTDNFLGAPVFHNDPDFAGSINEMRIWRGVLDSSDVAASFSSGPGTLIDPNSIAPNPEPFAITGVEIVDGNIVITGSSGLTAGQTYHLETGVTLDDFAPVPGSDFTGGDPIPPCPVGGPKRFVRIASGPGGE
ncbi:choice-of-anchor D domain-containing protein [Luteolibacter marinus]|uniref:choice-of-anchor D domain-containing protein n=1 Tax=Luteolibacter marinus TaxID=2776705 RepID=UPI00186954B7|nr:choice-of-anchor D domain-containing protein [Luteolibacter marinus]